ncbi:MAG: hypothetical protein RLZZ450_2926 [Pseudomonadota bacterium]|jgi:serine O-acetyltransferase
MAARRASLVKDIWLDLKMILAACNRPLELRHALWAFFACDGFILLMMFRTRQWLRRYHIPVLGRLVRLMETALFAVEISNDAELGHGVYFMHTVGTVIGGDAKIGDGCLLLGNNTIGQAERQGYPMIGAGTIIGAGVRVLGKIVVGDDCALGANAVVVDDVPSGKVAVGIPARVVGDNPRRLRE